MFKTLCYHDGDSMRPGLKRPGLMGESLDHLLRVRYKSHSGVASSGKSNMEN